LFCFIDNIICHEDGGEKHLSSSYILYEVYVRNNTCVMYQEKKIV